MQLTRLGAGRSLARPQGPRVQAEGPGGNGRWPAVGLCEEAGEAGTHRRSSVRKPLRGILLGPDSRWKGSALLTKFPGRLGAYSIALFATSR